MNAEQAAAEYRAAATTGEDRLRDAVAGLLNRLDDFPTFRSVMKHWMRKEYEAVVKALAGPEQKGVQG